MLSEEMLLLGESMNQAVEIPLQWFRCPTLGEFLHL